MFVCVRECMCVCIFCHDRRVSSFLRSLFFLSLSKKGKPNQQSPLISFNFSFLCFKYFDTWPVTAQKEG